VDFEAAEPFVCHRGFALNSILACVSWKGTNACRTRLIWLRTSAGGWVAAGLMAFATLWDVSGEGLERRLNFPGLF
jgi:hypothetical protein